MKKLFFILFLTSSIVASAQDWQMSYADAESISKKENKPILLVFSGSDWCAPCIKKERRILQSQEFIEYSKEDFELYRADFPRKESNQLPAEMARQNAKLAASFNRNGYFPLVVVLNPNEEVLGTTGYEKISPEQYISMLNSFIK